MESIKLKSSGQVSCRIFGFGSTWVQVANMVREASRGFNVLPSPMMNKMSHYQAQQSNGSRPPAEFSSAMLIVNPLHLLFPIVISTY